MDDPPMKELEEIARGTPEEMLALLRGPKQEGPPPWPCWCGRPLMPVFVDGRRVGVTHELQEDDDWHNGVDSSIVVEIVPEAAEPKT